MATSGTEAITLFQDNTERLDLFVNDPTGYTTSHGVAVKSVQKLSEEVDAIDVQVMADLASDDPLKGATLIGFKQPYTDAVAVTLRRKLLEIVSPEDFGAYGDGTHDDTIAITKCFNAGKPVFVTSGTYLITSVPITTKCHIEIAATATFKMAPHANMSLAGFVISVAGSYFEAFGLLDGNSTGRSIVSVVGDDIFVGLHRTENVTTETGSNGWVSGLEVNGGERFNGFVDGLNYSQTVVIGSAPRALTIQGTSSNYEVSYVRMENGYGTCAIGSATLGGHIGSIICRDVTDNGLYCLGDNVNVDFIDYVASSGFQGDEVVVLVGGKLNVEYLRARGKINKVVAVGMTNSLNNNRFGRITLDCGNGSVVAYRDSHSAGGRLAIGRLEGVIAGSTLFYMTEAGGTMEGFSIGSADLRWIYDPAVSGLLSGWMTLSGIKEFDLRNMNIKVIDSTSALTGSEYFRTVLPSTQLARPSFWYNNNVTVYQNDGVTPSLAYYRCYYVAQTLVWTKGCAFYEISSTIVARETTYVSGGPGENSISGIPTAGTWRQGMNLVDYNATVAPFNFRCTVAGTPGTWVAY